MNITIGVPVIAEDGQAGLVDRIILNPETHAVDGVLARQGWLLNRDVVIPIDRILAADDERLSVEGTSEALNELDGFSESQFTEPPEDWLPPDGGPASIYLFPASPYLVGAFELPSVQSEPPEHEVETLPAGEIGVGADTPVNCRDGRAGRLKQVLTAGYSDEATHLVIDRGGIGTRSLLVPLTSVTRMADDGIDLDLTLEELETLPEFSAEP